MKAIILAGGKGTRLEPYTTVFPKPLVPVGEKPILDIIIQQLSHYGIRDITLAVGYLAELIQAYFQNDNSDRTRTVDISYIKESKPTGTAGSLSLLKDIDKTFLVMNGDILTDLDYSKLITYHKEMDGILTIAMHEKKIKVDLGVLEIDSEQKLTDYTEKPEKTFMVSMGIYIFEPEVLSYIPKRAYMDFPDLVLKLIKSGEKVVGYKSDAYWLDIGRHEDYILAQEEYEKKKHLFVPNLKK